MSYHCPYPLIHTKKIRNTLNDIEVYGYIVTKRTGLGPTSNRPWDINVLSLRIESIIVMRSFVWSSKIHRTPRTNSLLP